MICIAQPADRSALSPTTAAICSPEVSGVGDIRLATIGTNRKPGGTDR
jgi:hypothetical protein